MDDMTSPADVIEALWTRMQARDWGGVRALLADDLVVEWFASLERIVGADDFVAVNAEYPEGWSIRILSVVADGEHVVSEVEVPQEGVGVFRAASFWTVRDGRIVEGREYWTTRGGDPAPGWRRHLVEVMSVE
ncbi:nuclear transport factor 2 family protein [Agromyces endophyticus]|uniref:nuclear transport factor 2 family protein n=1 Tax=Agromyces sp. H17E-10 TaxID=2932244 RepID=UPI001FCF8B62|nr:nuclear transport factor 2 family protein [Agromyces sp. H17E-10]UOQ88559.1 nuclear transport factor 2 family protein [Agromyces sp. H17E-10]